MSTRLKQRPVLGEKAFLRFVDEQRKQERSSKIERAIRLTWGSLQSHLDATHDLSHDRAFHRKCVQEYAEIIKILSELY
jgi:hypothetical protein